MTTYPANKRYKEKNIVMVGVPVNRKTEADILERIERAAEEESKAGYLKRLVREDIARDKKKGRE